MRPRTPLPLPWKYCRPFFVLFALLANSIGLFVILPLTVTAGCGLYLSYHLTFGGNVTIRKILDNILPLARPLLRVSLYFLPVYIASHLYIRQ